jgi:hypothetical protein
MPLGSPDFLFSRYIFALVPGLHSETIVRTEMIHAPPGRAHIIWYGAPGNEVLVTSTLPGLTLPRLSAEFDLVAQSWIQPASTSEPEFSG